MLDCVEGISNICIFLIVCVFFFCFYDMISGRMEFFLFSGFINIVYDLISIIICLYKNIFVEIKVIKKIK